MFIKGTLTTQTTLLLIIGWISLFARSYLHEELAVGGVRLRDDVELGFGQGVQHTHARGLMAAPHAQITAVSDDLNGN
eukprot:1178631-Prorocentrum_minimum.AAC.3